MMDNAVSKIKDAIDDLFGDRKALIRIIVIGLILILALVLRITDSHKADITVESADTIEETDETVDNTDVGGIMYVDIGGAVINPGVYQVEKETRLYQVIDMAGGLSDDADTDSINRASFVEDGQKILIPVKGAATGGSAVNTSSAAGSSYETNDSGLININTASADELKTLNGIGEVMAERIIEYRSSKAFKSIEDIMSVEGIGSKIFEKIKDQITC